MDTFLHWVGGALSVMSLAEVAVGTLMLVVSAVRFLAPSTGAPDLVAKGVAADAAKLIEALSKVPLWLAAVAVGDGPPLSSWRSREEPGP